MRSAYPSGQIGIGRCQPNRSPKAVIRGRGRPDQAGAPAKSRLGSIPQRSAYGRQLGVERPAVGPLLALVRGVGALQRHAAGVVADRADLRHSSARRAAARPAALASSARLASIGQASAPASWIRVGTTHSTAGWARFHWQASWIGVSRRVRRSAAPARASPARPRSSPPGGRRGGRPAPAPSPGRRSPQKRPP